MTESEFKQTVLSYIGKYPKYELEKFSKYYTTKKPFDKIKGFTLDRRLKTWFDPKRNKKFQDKCKKEKSKNTDTQNRIKMLKNFLGDVNPLR